MLFDTISLDQLATFEMGQSPDSNYVVESDEGTPFLQGCAEFGAITPNSVVSCIRPKKTCKPGDILISVRAPVGDLNKADREYCIGRGLAAIRFKNGIDTNFGWHLLSYWATSLRVVAQGSTFEAIGKQELANLQVADIPLSEQRRIAEILDTIDEAIQQTEALISKLKAMKQGLLHDLLTRGLDKNSKLRDPKAHPEQFKDSSLGRIPIEWEVGSINNLAINCDGRRIPLKQADRDKRHGIYPYYGASGIIDWIDDYLFDGDYVLLGEDGENVVSRELPLAFRASGKFWVNNHAHVFEPQHSVDIRYLTELLEYTNYNKIFLGSAQPKLTQEGLKRLLFQIPMPSEQAMIGDRLETYDARIRIEERYRDKLKLQEKGLMHDLLTGKVRVKV